MGKPTWTPGEFGTGIPEPKITGPFWDSCYWEGRYQGFLPSSGYAGKNVLWSIFFGVKQKLLGWNSPRWTFFFEQCWTRPKGGRRMKSFFCPHHPFLVGGWTNPLKIPSRNWITSPRFGVNIKNIWNHQPDPFFLECSGKKTISIGSCPKHWCTVENEGFFGGS